MEIKMRETEPYKGVQPEIKILAEKKLVGKRMSMSLVNNKTGELWRTFMPRRKEILNSMGPDFYSIQIYKDSHFDSFKPENEFEKWAVAEVKDFDHIPEGMEAVILPGGTYAVFIYKGLNTDTRIFQYIFSEWLPASQFVLDNRPHFEVLGDKYKNGDPDSEEEIWIPVRIK